MTSTMRLLAAAGAALLLGARPGAGGRALPRASAARSSASCANISSAIPKCCRKR